MYKEIQKESVAKSYYSWLTASSYFEIIVLHQQNEEFHRPEIFTLTVMQWYILI